MRIVLIKTVPKLGQPGTVHEVADGFAKNYLLPGGWAEVATKKRIQELKNLAIKNEQASSKSVKKHEEICKKLSGKRFEAKSKANEQGTLFSAIGPKGVSAILSQNGYNVPSTKIKLTKPLKHTGEHQVVVDFGGNVHTVVIMVITAE